MAKQKPGRGKQRSKEQQAARREARQAERQRLAEQKAERERARRRRRVLVQVGTAVGILALIGGLVAFFTLRESSSDITADGPPGTDDEGAVVSGSEDAPVEVEVITDFGCPACANFESSTAGALATYVEQDQVRLRYRLVSPIDRTSPNEFSRRSIAAAGCVLEQEDPQVWNDFKASVYAGQPPEGEDGLSDTQLIGLATAAGADEADVTGCVDEGRWLDWADAVDDQAAGDYSATPTVFVDGERLPEASPAATTAAIDAALAQG
ncbi:thioredoxin domain-containing protein [uncultured Nocardioides sp.]|uniref:DsbA family protein n=1 Tax=uncultured Nocardioides sp. TaxID=198441 RepID=UPI002604FAF3|nr:thioredoxin domain-containing protein [uncultured Nocardioides sp.]